VRLDEFCESGRGEEIVRRVIVLEGFLKVRDACLGLRVESDEGTKKRSALNVLVEELLDVVFEIELVEVLLMRNNRFTKIL
jgi:hypothetical protein